MADLRYVLPSSYTSICRMSLKSMSMWEVPSVLQVMYTHAAITWLDFRPLPSHKYCYCLKILRNLSIYLVTIRITILIYQVSDIWYIIGVFPFEHCFKCLLKRKPFKMTRADNINNLQTSPAQIERRSQFCITPLDFMYYVRHGFRAK